MSFTIWSSVNVVTALDTQESPAVPLQGLRELFARNRFHAREEAVTQVSLFEGRIRSNSDLYNASVSVLLRCRNVHRQTALDRLIKIL